MTLVRPVMGHADHHSRCRGNDMTVAVAVLSHRITAADAGRPGAGPVP